MTRWHVFVYLQEEVDMKVTWEKYPWHQKGKGIPTRTWERPQWTVQRPQIPPHGFVNGSPWFQHQLAMTWGQEVLPLVSCLRYRNTIQEFIQAFSESFHILAWTSSWGINHTEMQVSVPHYDLPARMDTINDISLVCFLTESITITRGL